MLVTCHVGLSTIHKNHTSVTYSSQQCGFVHSAYLACGAAMCMSYVHHLLSAATTWSQSFLHTFMSNCGWTRCCNACSVPLKGWDFSVAMGATGQA